MPSIAPNYPETRYPSPALPPPDFTSKRERERLSGAALKAFFNIIQQWAIRDEDARELLGGVSNGPYYQMKKSQEGRILSADELFRISYLIGIFKALNTLHGQHLADQWVRLPNSNRIFSGQSPLEYMKKGGQHGMEIVRELLESRIQGT
jgi:Antitoxin Xre-like helix-turn-helix domain